MLDRRTFLASSTAFSFLAFAGCATAPRQTAEERDRALHAMLQGWFDEDLRDNPTFATNLGLDVGELAPLRARLGDASLAKADEERAEAVARFRQLQAFGRDGLSSAGLNPPRSGCGVGCRAFGGRRSATGRSSPSRTSRSRAPCPGP